MSEQISPSDMGRFISSMRRKEEKVCPRCGASFVGIKTKLYCSHSCAVAAYADEHRGEINAGRRTRYRQRKQDE